MSLLWFGIFFNLITCSYCWWSTGVRTSKYKGLPRSKMETHTNPKVVGGHVALIFDYPFIVSIQAEIQYFSYEHRCGASLIDDSWILTAAHCLCVDKTTDTLPASNLKIAAGETYCDHPTVRFDVAEICIHEGYRATRFLNDIGLLRLTEPVKFTTVIKPVKLASTYEDPSDSDECTVAGWGRTAEFGPISATLFQVNLPIINNAKCAALLDPNYINKNNICTYVTSGGKDACFGDSGGPLLCNKTLVGIVSWGIGCARPRVPAVYMRVSSYADWIDDVRAQPRSGNFRLSKMNIFIICILNMIFLFIL